MIKTFEVFNDSPTNNEKYSYVLVGYRKWDTTTVYENGILKDEVNGYVKTVEKLLEVFHIDIEAYELKSMTRFVNILGGEFPEKLEDLKIFLEGEKLGLL